MNRLSTSGIVLAGLLLLQSASALKAAEPKRAVSEGGAPASHISDVALDDRGLLRGRVIDFHEEALPAATVTIGQDKRTLIRVTTNPEGEFAVSGLKGGLYQVSAGQTHRWYRVWAPGTAPPVADESLQLVVQDEVVRGQIGGPFWTTGRVLVGAGALAGAVTGASIRYRDKSTENLPASP